MEAFDNLISRKWNLQMQLQDPDRPQNSEIEAFYPKVCSLLDSLRDNIAVLSTSESGERLAQDIAHALWMTSQSEIIPTQEMDSFAERLEKLVADDRSRRGPARPKLSYSFPADVVPASHRNKIVGFEGELQELKDQLSRVWFQLRVIPICGMVGIGKTTLAMAFYVDPLVVEAFDIRVWITVSHGYCLRDILLDFLDSLPDSHDKMHNPEMSDEELKQCVYSILHARRYLFVLDDVRDTRSWRDFLGLFPITELTSSIIIVTTRDVETVSVSEYAESVLLVDFLDADESWDLLCEQVFGDEPCPDFAFEKIGRKIAENCQGLPLYIIAIGHHLATEEMSAEYWRNVAESGNSVLDETEEVAGLHEALASSYAHLPQHLKSCFLYMGVFPRGRRILASRIIKLWVAEGFVEENKYLTSEQMAAKYLLKLFRKSLLLIVAESSTGGIKAVALHTALWNACCKDAENEAVFFTIKSTGHADHDRNNHHHRLCVRNNILLGIKDVSKPIMDSMSANIHSIICMGRYHVYPLWLCWDRFRVLKLLDALTIRFHEFPREILGLFQLRYLALTCNRGEVPLGISNLKYLQLLIVLLHDVKLKSSSDAPSYLPMEIWDMQELRHLQVMGSNLPTPPCVSSALNHEKLLPNLVALLNVSPRSCTKEVFERVPNLRKLGIQIELPQCFDATSQPFTPFEHLVQLGMLETVKCIVENPHYYEPSSDHRQVFVNMPVGPLSSTSSVSVITKLTLSGCGLPWEDMKRIAEDLRYLEVLKLRCHAFRGNVWDLKKEVFERLKFMLLEDMDLVCWRSEDYCLKIDNFPRLEHLRIRHCYKLEEIPRNLRASNLIELFHCNSRAAVSAQRLREYAVSRTGSWVPEIRIHSPSQDVILKQPPNEVVVFS